MRGKGLLRISHILNPHPTGVNTLSLPSSPIFSVFANSDLQRPCTRPQFGFMMLQLSSSNTCCPNGNPNPQPSKPSLAQFWEHPFLEALLTSPSFYSFLPSSNRLSSVTFLFQALYLMTGIEKQVGHILCAQFSLICVVLLLENRSIVSMRCLFPEGQDHIQHIPTTYVVDTKCLPNAPI